MSNEFHFEIQDRITVLQEYPTGWRKELNVISWNGAEPKFDIRDWNQEHTHMSRGITLNVEEMKSLQEAIKDKDLDKEFHMLKRDRDERDSER